MKSVKQTRDAITKTLMTTLQYHEIKAVHVKFCGSGDSGDLEVSQLEPLTPEEEVPMGLIDLVRVPQVELGEIFEHEPGGDYRLRDWKAKPPTLRELIIDVCYEELERRHGGWEINAGSNGVIILTPMARHYKVDPIVVSIEYNYENSEYDYEDEEYNDE